MQGRENIKVLRESDQLLYTMEPFPPDRGKLQRKVKTQNRRGFDLRMTASAILVFGRKEGAYSGRLLGCRERRRWRRVNIVTLMSGRNLLWINQAWSLVNGGSVPHIGPFHSVLGNEAYTM